MSDYSKITNFTAKDALLTGNPNKLIKGSEHDAEYDAISTAIASKYDGTDITSQATAEAGTNNTELMTPLRTEQWSAVWAAENSGIVGDLQAYADPNADRIIFWDDSAGAATGLVVTPATAGIEITTTNLRLDIDSLTNVTPVAGDEVVIADASDSGLPKAVLLSDLANYMSGAVDHNSLVNYISNEHINHTAVSIAPGTGLTGGGTIAANRTLNLDISGLTSMTAAPAGTDSFLYNDGGTMKQMTYNQGALPSRNVSGSASFASTDCGTIIFYTGGTGTLTIDSSIGQDNTFIIVIHGGSGTLSIAPGGGVTLYSENTKRNMGVGAVACLIRYSSTVWFLGGNIKL